jgi:hypothetical protein
LRGSDNILARSVRALTSPITAAVGAVTPRIVPPTGVVACAIAWLIIFRVIVTMVAGGFGLRLWG